MRRIVKYTGDHTFMYPNGELATPEVMTARYPAILAFGHIIETDEQREVCYAIENLSAARSRHGIDPALTEEAAIAAIEVIVNTPPEIDATPGPDERMAAALEFQNMLAMAGGK